MSHTEDRLAIADIQIAYASALDTKEWSALHRVFTEDAIGDYGEFGLQNGCQAIADLCARVLGPLDASQHLLGNHSARIQGDNANAQCYFQAQHRRDGLADGSLFLVGGIYSDQLIRTDSGWRIMRRKFSVIWTDGNPEVLQG